MHLRNATRVSSLSTLLVLCLLAGPTQDSAAALGEPNVVVVLTDDQQFDSIHSMGNPLIRTPNLDRLATGGMIFRNAHIMGGWIGAVCLPSRTMIMTGRTLWHIPNIYGEMPLNRFPPNLADKTLPVVFNHAGYDTIRSGKFWNTYTDANGRFGTCLYHEQRDAISSSRFVDDALDWLTHRQALAKTNPFLIYLGFAHPHDPRHAPQAYLDHFHASAPKPDPNTPLNLLPPLPPNYLPRHPFDNGDLGVRDEVAVEGVGTNRDERTIRNELGKTYATIEYLDSQVGRLLARLDQLNQYTNTFFVFMGDNGVALGRHGLMGKQNLYEPSLRVPLAIAGPGIRPGTNDSLVYLLDVFPTLCDLTGLPAPTTVEGLSLAPILWGRANAVRQSILGSYLACQRAVRVGDWKLIHYPAIHRTQLFNLPHDPYETNDLSRVAGQAGRIKQLAAQLAALQHQYGDWQRSGQLGYIGANIALGKTAWQSSTEGTRTTYPAANATDGAGSTLSAWAQTAANDTNAWWQVDLGLQYRLEEVQVLNLSSGPKGRLRDLRIEVLDACSNIVAASDLLNAHNALGGGLNDFSVGPAYLLGGFTNRLPVGRYVRVSRSPASVGTGADRNALAMEEVQVFAAPAGAVRSSPAPPVPEVIKAYNLDFNWGPGGPNGFAKPGLWADADPARHVAWYKTLGANVIQTFCVSCNGYAWYKHGVVPEQPGLKYDFLPEVVRLGHQEGLLVMGYFCMGANTKWGQEHPQLSYGFPSAPHIPFTDEYLAYLDSAIRDAVAKTGMDGFMVDWLRLPTTRASNGGHWLECEKKLYTQLMGEPFPGEQQLSPAKMTEYGRRALDRCWTTIRRAAKETNPNCLIWLSSHDIYDPPIANSRTLRETDWFINEAGDLKRTADAKRMIGPQTRLITCLANWNRQDPMEIIPAALREGIGLYGFTKPGEDSLLPLETLLSRPIRELKGDEKNIAALARAFHGASAASTRAPDGRFVEPPK